MKGIEWERFLKSKKWGLTNPFSCCFQDRKVFFLPWKAKERGPLSKRCGTVWKEWEQKLKQRDIMIFHYVKNKIVFEIKN